MKFNQTPYTTSYFSTHIWIHCPKCNQPALVNTTLSQYTIPFPCNYQSECHCRSCGFKTTDINTWNGVLQGIIQRSCSHCGNKIHHITKPTKTPYKTDSVQCSICFTKKDYNITWYPYRKDQPTDPYFGFNLWLQTQVKTHTLWVYNLEHLQYLRDYISAYLREDKQRFKYAMISNLPQWMTNRKNRDLIVKKLNQLESQLQNRPS